MFKFDFNLEDTDSEVLDSNCIETGVNEEQTPQEKQPPPPLVTYQVQDLASKVDLDSRAQPRFHIDYSR